MTHDLRRELILSAAKRCFARNGFAGTTTKSVAAAASISEGLLFKHFPTKSALYAEILAEECEADPGLNKLLGLPPSTETLVILIRGMVGHFLDIPRDPDPDHEEAQRLRLMVISQLQDGEFARLLFDKIGELIGPTFTASLEHAVRTRRCGADRKRADGSFLVRAPHRDDGGFIAPSLGSLFALCQHRAIMSGNFANLFSAESD